MCMVLKLRAIVGRVSAINKWEIGGRRIPRQPGQVRKEAALTSSVRVACQSPTRCLNEHAPTKNTADGRP